METAGTTVNEIVPDSLLDALELDAAALLGHSGGGRWALWSDSGGRPAQRGALLGGAQHG